MLWSEFKSLWQSRGLVWVLIKREIAARNAGSAAGIVWVYAPPLLTVAAYYLVFDVVFGMRLGAQAPVRSAGAFLIVGSLPWMAFCDAITKGMNSLIESGGLLQKNPLPPALFPARSVLASAVVFGPMLLLVALAYGPVHRFAWALLALIPLALLQLVLCWVLAYLLALCAAALRDVVAIVGFLLSVGIFVSPVLFPAEMFPARWQWVLWMNPMTPLIEGYQTILLRGAWPDAMVWLVPSLWIGATTMLLQQAVRRSRDQLVDWL